MASPWPASLPQSFLVGTYQAQRPSTVIRSQPEQGPAIVRRRFSAAVMPFSGAMMMTEAQRAALAAFYDSTLAGGAGELTFPAPVGAGTWLCRFTAEPEESDVTPGYFRVILALEKMP